ncbi:MAG: hypothetical protein HC895_27210 [Leptolyngbyaceae cyanobacterium SM1_3_5]|nr:hypothetical protein [Leptolyngbyaceae cyanobacterium SM1_3_5]
MIPAAFVPIEAFPLTPSGKLDRRALPTVDRELAEPHHELAEPHRAALPVSAASSARSPTELALIEIWQELLRLQQVGIHDRFFDLGGHSLLATQMASRVRDALGVELPLRTVFEAPTIAQLAQSIETLRQTAPASPPPAIVRLDRAAHRRSRSSPPNFEPPPNFEQQPSLEQQPAIPQSPPPVENFGGKAWSPLVPIALGSGTPFFCVHPILGVVFPYLELAHQLGDRSFYGLQPIGIDGKQAPLTQIEAIAAFYVQAIQTVQPNGPYLIGGWSFGGLVAFEMAQQLTQANQTVALLAILDTPAPIATAQPSIAQTVQFLGKTLRSSLPFLLDYGAIATTLARSERKGWLSLWQWLAIAHLLPQESQLRLLDEAATRDRC